MGQLHPSIFFGGVGRDGNAMLFLVLIAVLSRLLTPVEFGIYAAVISLPALVAASSHEFSSANHLIQTPTLSEQEIRMAFTITFCLSILLSIGLFALRSVVASFYAGTRLMIGIGVFAASFALVPFRSRSRLCCTPKCPLISLPAAI